jgi:cardiolipin synthase A/B
MGASFWEGDMTIIQIAIPVLRGRRRFHVEKGRRWSVVEHVMLDTVARKPAAAAELAEKSDLPRRLVVEAFIRLMRVGWVELAPGPQGLIFTATSTGRAQIIRGDLRAPTVIQPRWMGFVIDQVAGSVFRRTEIAVRHQNELSKAGKNAVIYLDKCERHAREDLAELFAAMEGDDEEIVRVDPSPEKLVERFAIVTITDGMIEGLPGRAKPELYEAVLAKAAEAFRKAKSDRKGLPAAAPASAPTRSTQPVSALFEQADIIVDGPEHKTALERALSHAREQVIIHSTFISEQVIPAALPLLVGAAARGTFVHILWGQDDEKTSVSKSRKAAVALQGAIQGVGRAEQVIVHPFTTRSHAKMLISDDGSGRWSAIVGSCNWLSSEFDNFETSIRVRDPALVGHLIRHLAALSLGPSGVWNDLAKNLTVLGRRVEAEPPGNGRTAKMRILLSSDHGELVLEARDSARQRIFVTSHRIGLAGRPMVIIPTLAAAKAGQVKAQLYYGRPTGVLSGIDAADLAMEFAKQGVAIRPIHHPRLHAKILAWDDDAIAVTSQNWLSADPAEGAPRREIGIFVESNRAADYLIRRFEHARTSGRAFGASQNRA